MAWSSRGPVSEPAGSAASSGPGSCGEPLQLVLRGWTPVPRMEGALAVRVGGANPYGEQRFGAGGLGSRGAWCTGRLSTSGARDAAGRRSARRPSWSAGLRGARGAAPGRGLCPPSPWTRSRWPQLARRRTTPPAARGRPAHLPRLPPGDPPGGSSTVLGRRLAEGRPPGPRGRRGPPGRRPPRPRVRAPRRGAVPRAHVGAGAAGARAAPGGGARGSGGGPGHPGAARRAAAGGSGAPCSCPGGSPRRPEEGEERSG